MIIRYYNFFGQQTRVTTTLTYTGKKYIKYYTLQFTDGTRFLADSLSNLVSNLSQGIHKIKFKYEDNDKKCEICKIKYK